MNLELFITILTALLSANVANRLIDYGQNLYYAWSCRRLRASTEHILRARGVDQEVAATVASILHDTRPRIWFPPRITRLFG